VADVSNWSWTLSHWRKMGAWPPYKAPGSMSNPLELINWSLFPIFVLFS
jgi:hypothetical protein